MSEENQAIVRRFFDELWNTGNQDAIDELMDVNCDGDFFHPQSPATGPQYAFSNTASRGSSVTTRLEELAKTYPEIARCLIEKIRNFRGVIKLSAAKFRESFPDARCTIEEMFAERDMVWTRWKLRGTYETYNYSFRNYQKGKPITVIGVNISHIAEGKVQDYRSYIRFENRPIGSPSWCTF